MLLVLEKQRGYVINYAPQIFSIGVSALFVHCERPQTEFAKNERYKTTQLTLLKIYNLYKLIQKISILFIDYFIYDKK